MEARADDIRPYTRTRKSKFRSNQRASGYRLLRKSGCRGGYHPPAMLRFKFKKLPLKNKLSGPPANSKIKRTKKRPSCEGKRCFKSQRLRKQALHFLNNKKSFFLISLFYPIER